MTSPSPTPRRVLAALLLGLAAAPTAQADLGGRVGGVMVDAGAGLGAGDLPFRAGLGTTLGIHGWIGKYDDDLAIGRQWSFGLRLRSDAAFPPGPAEHRLHPTLEVARGVDLLVVGLRVGLLGGPTLTTDLDAGGTRLAGGTARVFGDVAYRFHRTWSTWLRLESGVDVDALRAEPALGVLVGVRALVPVRRRDGDGPQRRAPARGADGSAG